MHESPPDEKDQAIEVIVELAHELGITTEEIYKDWVVCHPRIILTLYAEADLKQPVSPEEDLSRSNI